MEGAQGVDEKIRKIANILTVVTNNAQNTIILLNDLPTLFNQLVLEINNLRSENEKLKKEVEELKKLREGVKAK